MEEWKDVIGFEGIYQISNYGNCKSLDRVIIRKNGRKYIIKGKVLSQHIDDRGYLRCSAGKIHKLVAEAFIPNPNNYNTVHHKDHNKLNNMVENLEWIDAETHNRSHGGQHPCKSVYQYSINNELINTYSSTQEAGRINNYSYSRIAKCCRNEQKIYKGYKWSYYPL